MINELIDNLHP